MWFKMGGANLEESVTAEAPPAVEIAGGNTITDTNLNLGSGEFPARPVIDAGKMMEGVRAVSGVDQFIQPQIQSDASGTRVGETVVLPGQQDPLVGSPDIMTRETQINSNQDGSLRSETTSLPADHIDAPVDASQTVNYEPVISTDTSGNLATDLKIGVPGDATDPIVPASERKWKGRIPSGAKPAGEPIANPTVEAAGGDGLQDQVVEQIAGGVPADGSAAPEGVDAPVAAGVESAALDSVVPADPASEAVGDEGQAVDEALPGPLDPLTGKPTGMALGQAIAAPTGPRPLTPEEQRDQELDEMDKAEEEKMGSLDYPDPVPPLPPRSDSDSKTVLTDEQVDNLSSTGVIRERPLGQVIDATTPPEPFGIPDAPVENNGAIDPAGRVGNTEAAAAPEEPQGGEPTEEVVPSAVEEPAEAPEAPVDEVVSDAPATVEPEVEAPESVAESSPTVDGEVQVGPEAGVAAVEVPAPAESLQEGFVAEANSAEEPVAEVASSEEPAQPAVESTDQASANVVEDLLKPLEDVMSMNLSDEIDRLSKLDANARSAEIKKLVQSGIRAKLKQEGKENFADVFDSMEDLEKKINAAQMVLEFMTGESQLVDSQDSSQSPQATD